MSAVAQPTTANEVIDLAALLAPIAGENPAGESLQYAGLYDEVRMERRADEDFAQGEWRKSNTKSADWNEVVRLTTEALTGQTKDLQVAAWLAEGLVKLHGFVGLRDGLKVMRGLHEQFWEQVYPEQDEDGMEARANSLAWLSSQLARSIKGVPLTSAHGGIGCSYLSWIEAQEFDIPESLDGLDAETVARFEELKQRAVGEGKTTSEMWRKAKNLTRRAFYEEIFALLDECRNELQSLDRVMDEKFDRETPGLGEMTKALDEVRELVEKIVKEKRMLEPDATSEEDGNTEGEIADGGDAEGHASSGTKGPIKTRKDALRRLAEVSEYFRRTEPQSPVAYLVRRAIKWGEMPLEVWLEDVIKEGGVLDRLRETLGLGTSSGGGGEEE
jgi:type VI secretion system protein ImpA